MKKIITKKESYMSFFDNFPYFSNYIFYASHYGTYDIYVDSIDNPNCIVLYSEPAFFIKGDPKQTNIEKLFQLFPRNSWIIPDSIEWKSYLSAYYQDNVVIHPRTLFDATPLTLEHVLTCRSNIPNNLRIEKISSTHIKKGIIYDDVISRFFTTSDFMETGFGYVLLDENNIEQGFALTNYPKNGNEIELYFRVGYDNHKIYRNKGIGTTLCTYLIEYCIHNGYVPTWDAANETSCNIAKKLGYRPLTNWFMYNITT